jgi:hypothetical protein
MSGAGKRASFPDLLQGGASVGSLSEAIATPKDRLGELTHEPFASHVALCEFAQTLKHTCVRCKVAPVGQQRPASYASIGCARRARHRITRLVILATPNLTPACSADNPAQHAARVCVSV